MLITVSPAKKLNMAPVEHLTPTTPDFSAEAQALVSAMADMQAGDLQRLMKLSEKLARVNVDRFSNFDQLPEKPALFTFAGDTYQGIDANSLDQDDIAWAQSHLRILSGLYGALRPLDAIRPYRLEMGTRLTTKYGRSLYDYWGDKISRTLNKAAASAGTDILVNCASQEYFRAVSIRALSLRVVTPVFYEEKNGDTKIVSFYAKRARGAMARYIIEHRLDDPASLKDFDSGGYAYRPDLSDENTFAFSRSA